MRKLRLGRELRVKTVKTVGGASFSGSLVLSASFGEVESIAAALSWRLKVLVVQLSGSRKREWGMWCED